MAVRQYVGARYTPKFYQNSQNPLSSEWEGNKAYEALTIVTYNNSSYTSKIPVPAGIGNPAQNPTYWVVTGNYNAQIEQYRQVTEGVQTNLTAEITNRESADKQLGEQIETASNKLTNQLNDTSTELTNKINAETSAREKADKTTLFIFGDSWCTVNYDVPGTPLQDLPVATTVMQQFYDNVFNYGVGGTSVSQFNTQVTKAKSEHPDIDKCDVLICGGVNSIYWTPMSSLDPIISDFNALYNLIYTNFPKARVFLAPSAAKYKAPGDNDIAYGSIVSAATNAGVIPLTETLLWLMDGSGRWYNTTSTISNEHAVHLSVAGYKRYFNIVHTLMNGGSLKQRGIVRVIFAATDHVGTPGNETINYMYYNMNSNVGILDLKLFITGADGKTPITIKQSDTTTMPIEFGLYEKGQTEANSVWLTAGIAGGNQLIEATITRTEITFMPPENTIAVIGQIIMPVRNIQRLAN